MLVKILGALDIASAIAFLMFIFGMDVFTAYLVFCGGILLMKGLFVVIGDVLSVVDLFSSLLLFSSIFFVVPLPLMWISAFLLLAKGVVSFL